MKIALSNIALPAYDHAGELHALAELGITGLEVAPSRVWRDTWEGLDAGAVAAYRREVEAAGLEVVGLHSLIYDHPDLGLFKNTETRARTLDFFAHLSAVCRDLGGRTLIWGGGRRRGDVPEEEAEAEAVRFMGDLMTRIEGHGTVFCFEPLGPTDSDFINSVVTAVLIAVRVSHPGLAVQIDAKALAENDEIAPEIFDAARPRLAHVHANEPGLDVIGRSGTVDHAEIGRQLRRIGYDGYVSIEQRMLQDRRPLEDVAVSAAAVTTAYGDRDP